MAAITQQQQQQQHSQQHQHSIQLLHTAATNHMPHGLGLLTTVASLPPKYRSRYLNIKTKCEIPLDLSVKPNSPEIANDVPIATTFTEVYTEPSSEPETQLSEEVVEMAEQTQTQTQTKTRVTELSSNSSSSSSSSSISSNSYSSQENEKPITPPLTPTPNSAIKRKYDAVCIDNEEHIIMDKYTNPLKMSKSVAHPTIKRESTPTKPIKATESAPRTTKMQPAVTKSTTKNKATRKLKFDEETSSPVSGTIIRPLEDITDGTVQYSNGDIDPRYNIVEITEETKAELAAIKNVIGDYICKLCRLKFDDAFGLARHRCACIVLLEYRCPECGKQFNCPANLASHRRWHKPKKEANGTASKKENRNTTEGAPKQKENRDVGQKGEELPFACSECGKCFKRQAYLRKHQLTHAKKSTSVTSTAKSNVEFAPVAFGQGILSKSETFVASSYHSYDGSSASSLHSYNGTNEDEGVVHNNVVSSYEYDADSLSDCSNSSAGYGRLQIVESGLTEEENIAAAALTNLRNCTSVIQHTTLAH
ncbi:protein sister of odd and bowel [Teleopsis dalmanni]|uniref:protein sister of odd and bowel n=1 Tax=Teleopsis dalmanni TaxID=139649 RepID=UPI0018CE1CF9|nr:protein sister of odd and bowel [Teleopsis dalmanni]